MTDLNKICLRNAITNIALENKPEVHFESSYCSCYNICLHNQKDAKIIIKNICKDALKAAWDLQTPVMSKLPPNYENLLQYVSDIIMYAHIKKEDLEDLIKNTWKPYLKDTIKTTHIALRRNDFPLGVVALIINFV